MGPLLPVVGVLIAAAITPGPNNLIVMEAGARRGSIAVGASMLGVILGSLVLLTLIWGGMGAAMQTIPSVERALGIAGGTYLGWLGASLVIRRVQDRELRLSRTVLPSSTFSVAAFQLLNPKAWVLATTAVAAMSGSGGILLLAALMVVVMSFCLGLWALAGAVLARMLARPHARLWFDRTMGGLLAFSALGIIANA